MPYTRARYPAILDTVVLQSLPAPGSYTQLALLSTRAHDTAVLEMLDEAGRLGADGIYFIESEQGTVTHSERSGDKADVISEPSTILRAIAIRLNTP